eukprot:749133-Hanusia_phi.AAC.4
MRNRRARSLSENEWVWKLTGVKLNHARTSNNRGEQEPTRRAERVSVCDVRTRRRGGGDERDGARKRRRQRSLAEIANC